MSVSPSSFLNSVVMSLSLEVELGKFRLPLLAQEVSTMGLKRHGTW